MVGILAIKWKSIIVGFFGFLLSVRAVLWAECSGSWPLPGPVLHARGHFLGTGTCHPVAGHHPLPPVSSTSGSRPSAPCICWATHGFHIRAPQLFAGLKKFGVWDWFAAAPPCWMLPNPSLSGLFPEDCRACCLVSWGDCGRCCWRGCRVAGACCSPQPCSRPAASHRPCSAVVRGTKYIFNGGCLAHGPQRRIARGIVRTRSGALATTWGPSLRWLCLQGQAPCGCHTMALHRDEGAGKVTGLGWAPA